MTYQFKSHEKGDTLSAVEFQLKINDLAINLSGCNITATFALNLQSIIMGIGSGLEFTDAPAGKFKIQEQIIDWKAGNWKMEVRFYFADGKTKTYLKGNLQITD